MTLQKKIARKKIWLEIVLVWFGLYICPDKPEPIYYGDSRLGKRTRQP